MRFFTFFSKIGKYIIRGQFSLGLNEIARRCPNWLFRYNKAWIMRANNFQFPEVNRDDVNVKTADNSDIDDIARISGQDKDHIEKLMDMGAVCFLASVGDNRPVSLTWSASGQCLVRGMGFLYDYGSDGFYSFGSVTLPAARRKGIYRVLQSHKARYEKDQGAKGFYCLVEFTNTYSRSLREKLGYRTIQNVGYLKVFCLRFCVVKDLENNKLSFRFFIREPKGNFIVI